MIAPAAATPRSLRLLRAVLAALALAGCTAAPAPRAAVSFALIGDLPYGAREAEAFDTMLDAINSDPSIAFVLHAGDIKGAAEPCSDELIRARYEQLQRVRTALVYTPGDNEWADCHRRFAGRFDPLERLAFLRRLFFHDPACTTGLRPFKVEPQSVQPGFGEFVENVLFVRERVVFASLHLVGSDNDLAPWRGIDPGDSREHPRADRRREVERRNAAALAWLEHAFEHARAADAAAVILLMQANPRFDLPPVHPRRAPFEPLIERLRVCARAFGRPVLLAHGDLHELIIDRPLADVPNLTRVQTFGSPQVRWVRVDVDPSSATVLRLVPR